MRYRDIHTLTRNCGFEVTAFDQAPKVCGSWDASIQRLTDSYHIVSDRPEACFGLWHVQAQQYCLVFGGVKLHILNDVLELAMLQVWLKQLSLD